MVMNMMFINVSNNQKIKERGNFNRTSCPYAGRALTFL